MLIMSNLYVKIMLIHLKNVIKKSKLYYKKSITTIYYISQYVFYQAISY